MNATRRYVNIMERYYVEFDRRIGRNWSDAAAFFLIYRNICFLRIHLSLDRHEMEDQYPNFVNDQF